MSMIENLEGLLAQGQDTALLRFTLGSEYAKQGDPDTACEHLAKAVEMDEAYSAAWKRYGQALADAGCVDQAISAYEKGIEMAENKGDLQAAKEMKVFLKRLRKQQGTNE